MVETATKFLPFAISNSQEFVPVKHLVPGLDLGRVLCVTGMAPAVVETI